MYSDVRLCGTQKHMGSDMPVFIVSEEGDFILTEDGDFLIIDEKLFASPRRTYTALGRTVNFTLLKAITIRGDL